MATKKTTEKVAKTVTELQAELLSETQKQNEARLQAFAAEIEKACNHFDCKLIASVTFTGGFEPSFKVVAAINTK